MPIKFQKFIKRQDLRDNPGDFYLFGDNLAREGQGGQAKEMRGEHNALGVATKVRPLNTKGSYFTEENFDQYVDLVKRDLWTLELALQYGSVVVFPEDGIGTGYARLEQKCPRMFRLIQDKLKELIDEYA